MQILIDGTTTRFQLACLSKLLLALASDTDFDAIGDLVAPQPKADPEPIKLIDDVPPIPCRGDDVADPLTVMQAQLDIKAGDKIAPCDILPQGATIVGQLHGSEPPAPPKPARAPRKPKSAAEPPAPIPAIPVPPPVAIEAVAIAAGIPSRYLTGEQLSIPMPPQTAPTVPAMPLPPAPTAASTTVPVPPVTTGSSALSAPTPSTFPELMQWAMPHIAAKRMDNTTLTAACNAAGLPSLQSLIARQDLVGAVHANLLAAIGGGAS